MAKCVKCGADLPLNGKFCIKCGTPTSATPVYQSAPVQPQQAVKKDKQPMNKKTLRTLIIVAVVLAVIIAGIIVAVVLSNKAKEEKAKTLVITDYFELVFEGFDTKGTARLEFDYDEFYSDALEAQGYDDDTTSTRAIRKTQDLIDGIEYEISETENLSIGDKIKVTITCDEDAIEKADVIIEDAKFTVTIGNADLSQVRKINPFDEVSITFTGVDGSVTAEIENNATEEPMSELYFANSYYLNIGDEIDLEIRDWYINYALENYGIIYTQTEYSYIVSESDVDKYVESVDDFTPATIEAIADAAEVKIDAILTSGHTYDDIEYYGMYVVTYDYDDTRVRNDVYAVMTTTINPGTAGDFEPVSVYIPVKFRDVYITAATDELVFSGLSIPSSNDVLIKTSSVYDIRINGYHTELKMFEALITNNGDMVSYSVSGKLEDLSNIVE